MSGWLGNASIPSMPSMPAMPAMPSMPSIPGLRKTNTGEGGEGLTNEGLATSPDHQNSANIGEHSGQERTIDDDDRSRYIRYGPCISDGKRMVFQYVFFFDAFML